MKLTRFACLALSALLAFSSSVALAQVPSVSYGSPAQLRTYRATTLNLAPAASATDFFTIQGVAGRQVRVRKLFCSGISTANASALVQVVKRSTLDTTGTSTSPAAVPLNATSAAAGAVVKAYTVNPGALGTAIGAIAADFLVTNTLASATIANDDLTFDFSNQFVMLNSATQQLALNANAQSFTAGTAVSCTAEWTEQ